MRFTVALGFLAIIISVNARIIFLEDDYGKPDFETDILKKILLKDTKNTILSPFSIKLVLSLLKEASPLGTNTRKELDNVIPASIHLEEVHKFYTSLLKSLKQKNENYELNVGSKLFVDAAASPNEEYISILKSFYDTSISKLDFFEAEESADAINQWTSDITNGHIKDLVSADDFTDKLAAIIVNALYFKGNWENAFDEEHNIVRPFKTPTKPVDVTFMTKNSKIEQFYSQESKVTYIRLPYKGGKYAMTLALPDEVDGLDNFIQNFKVGTLAEVREKMYKEDVEIHVPKFEFVFEAKLKDTLKSMGLHRIFSDRAELIGLSNKDELKVSNIIQKAGIIVNERGTEAYAATEVEIGNKFLDDVVKFDHPFAFFIDDEASGAILFAGKVTNPLI